MGARVDWVGFAISRAGLFVLIGFGSLIGGSWFAPLAASRRCERVEIRPAPADDAKRRLNAPPDVALKFSAN
jgi:hypothetical protein